MPEIVATALLNRLNPSITFVLDGLAEKAFCRSHIALCPEHEVHCLAGPIHRPVQMPICHESSDRSRQRARTSLPACQTGSSA